LTIIQKFTSSGEFIRASGSHGTGDGQFEAPFDIAVDSNDDIYVTDRDLQRVYKSLHLLMILLENGANSVLVRRVILTTHAR
jgi:hypothetical protein